MLAPHPAWLLFACSMAIQHRQAKSCAFYFYPCFGVMDWVTLLSYMITAVWTSPGKFFFSCPKENY